MRIEGIDDQMGVHLAAYAGDPAAFPQAGDPETFPTTTSGYALLNSTVNFFIVDRDPIEDKTWRALETELMLPQGTDFVVVFLEAYENRVNDGSNDIREFGPAGPLTDRVLVALDAGNHRPFASDDAATIAEDTPTPVFVLRNDEDPDGLLVDSTVTVTGGPDNGTASVIIQTGGILYTPNPGFSGDDAFNYTVADDEGAVSNEATVTITVITDNIPPIARDDAATAAPRSTIIIDVLANDEDVDGTLDPSTLFFPNSIFTSSGQATVDRTADFKVIYRVGRFTGTDTFTYTVRDNDGAVSNEATVTVIVQ